MIYVFYNKETETRAEVTTTVYKEELLSSDEKTLAITVDSVPEPVKQVGKDPIHYINPQTKEQWYEYVDRPLNAEELLAQQATEIIDLKSQNAQILLSLVQGGLM